MKRLKYWGVVAVVGLLIITVIWWAATMIKDLKEPLNQSDAFVYSDNGILSWFELTSHRGKVEGKLHQQRYIEETGIAPFMDEKKYPLTGKTTEKGYEFNVDYGGEIVTYDAAFSGPHLSVVMKGQKDNKLYNPVDYNELEEYVDALKDYHTEERENNRLKKFFSDLRDVYGYLYSASNGSFQLFIKIDEALLEGELTGSLLLLDDKGTEATYVLNGITDGRMVEFFTQVNGKTTKLEGHFHEDATEFDLSFWMTDQKLSFHAVTEEEFNQSYQEIKKK